MQYATFLLLATQPNTQVNAIADSVQKETLEILADKALHKEGTETAEWILLDYVNGSSYIPNSLKRILCIGRIMGRR